MASVSDTELARDIRNGEIANIYYFFGKDVAQIEAYTKKLVKKLVPSEAQAMNYQSFDGKNFDLSVFSDSCEVYPMFADRVVVTVNDLNAESLNANDYKFLTQVLSSLPYCSAASLRLNNSFQLNISIFSYLKLLINLKL